MDGLSLFKIQRYIQKKYIPCQLNAVYFSDGGILLDIYKEKKETIFLDFNRNLILFGFDAPKLGKIEYFHKNRLIKSVKQRGYDRILEFEIISRKQSGKLETFYIVCEFIGSNSNLFILNEDRKILFKLNEKNADKDRDISIGSAYCYFKRNKAMTIDNLNASSFKSFEDVEGFYLPTAKYANYIVEQYGFEKGLNLLRKELDNDFLYVDSNGKFYPFAIKDNLIECNIHDFRPIAKTHNEKHTYLRNRLLLLISKQIKKEKALLEKLEAELKNALKYDDYKKEAELLKNNYHLLKNSKGDVLVYEYTETGETEKIINVDNISNLDETINKLFERYKKLKRSIEHIKRRIEEVKLKILELTEEEFNIETASKNELEIIYQTYFPDKKNIKKKEIIEKIKKVHFQGFDILIGKNSNSNHELVFHIASSNDVWMHAQKIPSAHIVIKNITNEEIPENVLLFAARITAYFSKAKDDKKVNIDYTFKKYVKKPPGSKEGFVIYSNFKTILAEPLTVEEAIKIGL